jgi:aryl-alcohol dehydrogenase-like predicted oxidoreductase
VEAARDRGDALLGLLGQLKSRALGSLRVSEVGLGCNAFGLSLGAREAAAVVGAALDHGITFFDVADSYGATKGEELLGQALRARRDEAIVATKFGTPIDEDRPGGARPEYVRAAAEASLQRLRTDRIDLYQLHVPDPDVPIEETLGALNELVREGKVRELGCSNFSAADLAAAASAPVADGGKRFASVQNEYSLIRRGAADVLAECRRHGVAFIPYYPLAGGLLTGKYRRGEEPPAGSRLAPGSRGTRPAAGTPALVEWLRTGRLPRIPRRRELLNERNLDLVEDLAAFAEARGRTLLELAFAWLLAHPEIPTVIAGATRPEQVTANAAAAGWVLGAEDRAELGALLDATRDSS